VPFVAPYSREYRDVTPNTALLSYLTEQTGDEFLEPSNLGAGVAWLLAAATTSTAPANRAGGPTVRAVKYLH